jgi:hypothetical protein
LCHRQARSAVSVLVSFADVRRRLPVITFESKPGCSSSAHMPGRCRVELESTRIAELAGCCHSFGCGPGGAWPHGSHTDRVQPVNSGHCYCHRASGALGCACSGGSQPAAPTGCRAAFGRLADPANGGARWGQGCARNGCGMLFRARRPDFSNFPRAMHSLAHRHSRAC